MIKKLYSNINFVKGILIILVILGHVIQGNIKEILSRHMIYFLHMPLFVGISGYLYNLDRLENDLVKAIKKISSRLLFPWILINFLYTLSLNYEIILQFKILELCTEIVKNLVYPYYHLWYILGYISYVLLLYFSTKISYLKNVKVRFSLILMFSIIMYILYFYFEKSKLIKIIFNNTQWYLFIFFYIGHLIKKQNEQKKSRINSSKILLYLSIMLILVSSILTFYIKNKFVFIFLYYLTNIILLFNVIKICIINTQIKNNLITEIGEYSLEIYLLHAFPILFVKKIIKIYDFKFYLVLFSLELLLIYLVIKIKKRSSYEKISLYNRIKS